MLSLRRLWWAITLPFDALGAVIAGWFLLLFTIMGFDITNEDLLYTQPLPPFPTDAQEEPVEWNAFFAPLEDEPVPAPIYVNILGANVPVEITAADGGYKVTSVCVDITGVGRSVQAAKYDFKLQCQGRMETAD